MSPITGVILILSLCAAIYAQQGPCNIDKGKPGQCPEPTENCFVGPRNDGICTKDCHCPEQQKCCVQMCEYACIDIDTVPQKG